MTNDIIILKNNCDAAIADLSTISRKVISLCNKMLDACSVRTTAFGEPKNDKAKCEIVETCVKYIKQINALSDEALGCVGIIYRSIIKYNELWNTPYFSLANEIGNVFEDLYEKDVPQALNDALTALDIDNDGAQIKVNSVTLSVKKIANSVSKATKFYFNED